MFIILKKIKIFFIINVLGMRRLDGGVKIFLKKMSTF